MDELHEQLGENIRHYAKKRGIPLYHVADRTQCSRSHFWAILGAERSPTLRMIAAIAEALDVTVNELLEAPTTKTTRRGRPRSKR